MYNNDITFNIICIYIFYIFLAVCCVVGVQKEIFNVIRSKRPVARVVRDTNLFRSLTETKKHLRKEKIKTTK